MPPIATGVATRVIYKAEANWGVAPGTGAAQALRRVSCNLALKKPGFESGELASHYQRNDYRHGVRSVAGAINGELSPGTYKDFIAAAVRKAFAAVTAIAGASITVGGAGPTYTITRAAGSFITDGIKKGQVVRLTAGGFNAANLNKNLAVIAVTSATVLTVMPLNGVALVAEGPIAAATVSVPGKVTYAPSTGHTDLSFAIERSYTDVVLSELFLGCKVNQVSVAMPPAGMATIGLEFLGKDMQTQAGQYYVAPTAETTSGIVAASTGLLVAQGGAIALVTGLSFTVKGNMSAEPVVGSNVYADIAEGSIVVDGQLTALFTDATMRDYFINETEVSLMAFLASNPLAGSEFAAVTFPRVKFGDASKDDGPKSLIQTMPFVSLYNAAGGAAADQEQTSLYVQDSLA